MNEEIKEYILSCRDNRKQATAFFKTLGITPETVEEYKLGYDPDLDQYIIPGSEYFDCFLAIDKDGQPKRYEPKDGSPIFFEHNIDKEEPCYIVERPIDALSIIQESEGKCNVIAVGKKGIEAFPEIYKKHNPSCRFILWFSEIDREIQIVRFFEAIKNRYYIVKGEYAKTANEMLQADRESLYLGIKADIKDVLEATDPDQELEQMAKEQEEEKKKSFRAVNVSEYLDKANFLEDIKYFQKYKNRKTGFENIDKYLTLYPGLACLTGSTSLGKTTFCVQLADQLIEKGESVIFFSLEQLPIEIVTKSLARGYYLRGGFNFKNNDIKEGATDDRLEAEKSQYAKKAKNFEIVSSDFNMTADQIIGYVNDYIKRTETKPIVIVDYLQIVAAPEGSRLDDRGRIDDAIKKLKKLSREQELFILAVSSMARNSYREKLNEAGFKESGLVEYSCDYLFGLQLSILEEDEFFQKTGSRGGTKETLVSEKQDKIDEASEAMPKEVVFKCMKNRNGKKVFRAFFRYHPEYDYFEEQDKTAAKKQQNKAI